MVLQRGLQQGLGIVVCGRRGGQPATGVCVGSAAHGSSSRGLRQLAPRPLQTTQHPRCTLRATILDLPTNGTRGRGYKFQAGPPAGGHCCPALGQHRRSLSCCALRLCHYACAVVVVSLPVRSYELHGARPAPCFDQVGPPPPCSAVQLSAIMVAHQPVVLSSYASQAADLASVAG